MQDSQKQCRIRVLTDTNHDTIIDESIEHDDAFAAPMRAAFESLGPTVNFVDNWKSYQVRAGEVHCGTNAIRRVETSTGERLILLCNSALRAGTQHLSMCSCTSPSGSIPDSHWSNPEEALKSYLGNAEV